MPAGPVERRLIYGIDTSPSLVDVLKESGASNPILVSSADYSSTSFYRKIKGMLDNSFTEYREITTGPPLPEVEHLAEMFRNRKCDYIVSVGDSNVIRASKLLKYYYAHDTDHLAIPTTLTSSSFSGLTEYRLGDEIYHIADPSIVPDAVILDPIASVETETSVWYSSGLEMMDYAFSNLHTAEISEEERDLLSSSLESLIVNLPGKSMESRMECFLSSWYSKEDNYDVESDPMTSVRDSIRSSADLPDNVLSAIILPLTVLGCRDEVPESLACLANRLGFKGNNVLELSDKVLESVQGLIRKLGFVDSFRGLGLDYKALKKMITSLPVEEKTVERALAPVFRSP